MFVVEHYKTSNGNDPVKEYLIEVANKYGTKDVVNIRTAITLLKNHGFNANKYRKNLIKPLGDGLYELRPGDNRIFFFSFNGKGFVLLSGFRKKTNKTPPNKLSLAKKQMKDYQRRNKQ